MSSAGMVLSAPRIDIAPSLQRLRTMECPAAGSRLFATVPRGRMPAQKSSSAAKSTPYLIDVRTLVALALSGLFAATLIGFYLWMVRPAAAREAEAACNGLRPSPTNPALGTLPVAAPDFKVVGHDGVSVSLSQFRGKVVLLNFWASWCGVCEMEKPAVFHVADDLGGEDFVVLSLAADTDWAEVLVALSKAYDPRAVPDKFKKVPPDK